MKETSEFYQTFKTGNLLGEGNFSSVRECILRKGEGIKYAVKMVKLSGSKEKKEEIKSMMQGEVNVMQKLDCKNIIKCIDAFFGANEILVVLEFTSVRCSKIFQSNNLKKYINLNALKIVS